MYGEQLNKKSPSILVKTEEDFRTLMNEVDAATVISEDDPQSVVIISDVDNEKKLFQITNDNAENGDLVLITKGQAWQPVIPSAIDSITARADLTCRLIAELFNRKKKEEGVNLLNRGLLLKAELKKELSTEKGKELPSCQIVKRSGWVIGAMSNQWTHLPQSELAEVVLSEIRASFPDAEFVSATYTHELTEFWVSLGNHQSEIMKQYRNGWVASGLPEEALENVKPLIRVATSDTGQSGVVVTPILQDRKYNRVLGERLSTKHAGKNSLEDVKKDLGQAFAKAQESLEKVAQLMATPIQNPTAVMVRALEAGKRSLWSLSHEACVDVLEHFTNLYRGATGITAYDIYSCIGEMEYCDKVTNLKQNSAIQIVEAIYRLINLDWAKLDAPGKSYLGDGLKKKGGTK